MSRRSLGSTWDTVSPSEKQEFVRLFTSLIANSYMGKIEQYTGEPIRYESEQIDGSEASVLSRVVTELGSVHRITTKTIEGLFASDLSYLQGLYERINGEEDAVTDGAALFGRENNSIYLADHQFILHKDHYLKHFGANSKPLTQPA